MRNIHLSSRINSVLLFIVITSFLGCGNTSSQNKDDKDPSKTQLRINGIKDTCLVYFENINKVYTCIMHDLKKGDTVQLAHFTSMPLETLWDTVSKIAYFFTSDGFIKCRYDSILGLDKIPGSLGKDIYLKEAWIDSASGNIRMYYIVYSYNFNSEQKKLYKDLTSKMDTSSLPPVGALKFVSELSNDGKTKILNSEVMSSGEMYYGGNVNVIPHDLKKEKKGMIKLSDMIGKGGAIYPGGNIKFTEILSDSYSQYGIEKYSRQDIPYFKLIEFEMPNDIITGVIYGDLPHLSPPVLVYNKASKKISELKDIAQDQLGIEIMGDYVLFAYEYHNSDIIIYNWKTQQKILSLKDGTGGFIAKM